MNEIKVLVVDDHALIRRGITALLAEHESLKAVGEASDGLEAIKKAREVNPDVVIMDLSMPNCSGLDATQAFQAEMPKINILILTVSEKAEDLFDALKYGARGYILKSATPEEIIHAIIHIAQGGVIVSPPMATHLLDEFKELRPTVSKENAGEEALSSREMEVLKLVAQGATNKEISDSLFVSENTAKTHMRNIMDKLHLANRGQAAAYAFKKGLIKDIK